MTPDELRKSKFYSDLFKLPEDERIDLIGHYVIEHNARVAFLTDSGPGDEGKADRYISKLKKKFPSVQISPIESGPVENTVCIRVGPPVN